MKQGSLRVLYKITGVRRFWNGVILEAKDSFLVNRENLRVTEIFNHPITKGVTELIFSNCTFFSITEEEIDDIIVTSEKAEFKYFVDNSVGPIGTVPICVASEFYNGRCVTLGSSDLFIEDSDYGLDAGDNLKFVERVIRWLAFEI